MSTRTKDAEQERAEQGGGPEAMVKALTVAAASAAATYAVRKALSARNDDEDEADNDAPDDSVDAEDDAEDADAEDGQADEGDPQASAEDEDEDGEDDQQDVEDREQGDHGEDDEEGDEDEDVGEVDRSEGSGGSRSKLQAVASSPVSSSALAVASHVLMPLAEELADSAGRYLAERGPDLVRERLVPRFIEAFEKAA